MTKQTNPVIDLAERSREKQQRKQRRQWLPQHCAGDKQAFPQLLQWLRQPVYNYLVRCGIGAASRDDLFQDIFLKIHAAAATYQPSRPLKPWVFTIAANTVRNHFRAENKRPTVPINNELDIHADPAPDTERRAAASETASWLEQAIAGLPLAQREVLVLVTHQELPLKTVADILQIPLNTVKTHLRRARLALLEAKAGREQEEEYA